SRVWWWLEATIGPWSDAGPEQRRDELPGFRVPRLEGRGRNKRAAGARRVPRVDHAESPQGHLPDAAGFERTRRPSVDDDAHVVFRQPRACTFPCVRIVAVPALDRLP